MRCAKDAGLFVGSTPTVGTIYASVAQQEVQHSSKVWVQRSSRCRGTMILTTSSIGRASDSDSESSRFESLVVNHMPGWLQSADTTSSKLVSCGFESHIRHH